jgi:large conductance mechanosensitive channel
MLKEFRDFIIKGNALDLAIGVILAVAFGAVVVAFTEVLLAFVAAFVGKPDFNALAFNVNGTPIPYGKVITTLINLLLVGGVLFLVVKAVNRMRGPAKAAPETDHDLLAQIRDELRSRPRIDRGIQSPA